MNNSLSEAVYGNPLQENIVQPYPLYRLYPVAI
jgi:hypothetical protein